MRGRLAKSWEPALEAAMTTPAIQGERLQNKTIKFVSPETWAVKLVQIMWNNIILIWEVRNTTIQQHYADKGQKRAHELLVQAANQEIQDTTYVPPLDLEWLNKSTEELRAMHPISLQYWMENIKKLKKWGKQFYNSETARLQFPNQGI